MRKFLPLLSLALLSSTAVAANYGNLYGGFLNYRGSDRKNWGLFAGYYGYSTLSKGNTLSYGLGFTSIEYKTNSTVLSTGRGTRTVYVSGVTHLNQWDLTLALSNYRILKNTSLYGGAHFIKTDDDLTDKGVVLFSDITRSFYYAKYNFGIFASASLYRNLTNFNVYQLTPHFGAYIYPKGKMVYLAVSGTLINIPRYAYVGLSNPNYLSGSLSATLIQKNQKFSLFGMFGKESFCVQNGGFTVYNLAEQYKGRFGFSYTYTPDNYKSVYQLSVSESIYKELETGDTAFQDTIYLSYGEFF